MIETSVSTVHSTMALSISTAAELSSRVNLWTPQPRRKSLGGRGWQECIEPDEGYAPGRIVGHFNEVIICVLPRVLFFAARRSTRRHHPNGRVDCPLDDGIVVIDCRRVELAAEIFDAPTPSEGFRRARMAGMHRAGRGVRVRSYRWTF